MKFWLLETGFRKNNSKACAKIRDFDAKPELQKSLASFIIFWLGLLQRSQ